MVRESGALRVEKIVALFEGVEEVGVASGLSTPPNLVEDVVARLYRASGGTPLLGAKAAHPPSAGTRGGPLSDLQERQLAHPQAGTRE